MNRPHSRNSVCSVGALLGVILVPCGSLRAADPQLAPRGAPSDVYVNDSFEAGDAIGKAAEQARRGRWPEAAALLQRAADLEPDRVIRLAPGQYAGLQQHIADIIAGWPEDGLIAYRDRAERSIREALQECGDGCSLEWMLLLFDRYFPTASAGTLAHRIAQIAIEEADLDLAARVYQRVLDAHPDRLALGDDYRPMLSIVRAMQGRTATDADAAIEARLRWMGVEHSLAEIRPQATTIFEALRAPPSTADWPLLGGDNLRSRTSPAELEEPALLWRFGAAPAPPLSDGSSFTGAMAGTSFLSPTVVGDIVVVQAFRSVTALRATTGAVVWRYGPDSDTVGPSDDFGDRPAGMETPTIAGGRVYASLPTDADPFYGSSSNSRPSAIACVDLSTGRQIWRTEARQFGDGSGEMVFDASPLVDHGRVYVVGRKRRSFGFEDCYLFAFDSANGSLVFRTHLGSASTGTFGSRPVTTSVPAKYGDTVFVATNLGSVAAVSAHTGSVRWLRLYPRQVADSDGNQWSGRDLPPWAANPVLWSDGRLHVLPTDNRELLVFDATTGERSALPASPDLGEVDTLVGAVGNVVCAAGRVVSCVNTDQGEVAWSVPLEPDEQLVGRGVWTAKGTLVIPTSRGLAQYQVRDGSRELFPWERGGHGGNIVAVRDRLFVGGLGTVSAYARRSEMWQALRERMKAFERDPVPAIELAEVAMRSSDVEQALAALAEGVRRAELVGRPAPDLQRRIYEDSLLLADALLASGRAMQATIETLQLYATTYAPDAPAQLDQRIQFAMVFERAGLPEPAVRLMQQVLRDRSLRDVVATRFQRPGAELARDAIDRLIERSGRAVYATFDAEAKAALDSARAVGDLGALAAILDNFPNSDAAPLSLLAQADILLTQNRPMAAAKALVRTYVRYPQLPDRPILLRRVADAYERAGKPQQAYRWLNRAAREFPQYRFDAGGRSTTFAQYRDRLGDVRAAVDPVRPVVELPLAASEPVELPGGTSLLAPRFADDPSNRWSRYFCADNERVTAFDSRTGAPAWKEPALIGTAVELLVATDEVAAFASTDELFAIAVATGERRWTLGRPPRMAERPDDDWEHGQGIRSCDLEQDRLVCVRDGGEMFSLSIRTGTVHWVQTYRPTAVGPVRILDPWVVYHIQQDGAAVICLVDLETGKWIDAIPTQESRPIEAIYVPLDGQLLTLTSQTMACYDTEVRAWRWQTSLDGHVRRSSLLFDLDSVFLSDDGYHVRRFSLETGRMEWESARLQQRGGGDISVDRIGPTLIVTTSLGVTALDSVDGRTLWEGTTPARPRFTRRFITRHYVGVLDTPPADAREGDTSLIFYDHRNASGLIPRDGGIIDMGRLTDVRQILALEGSIVIQNGSSLISYRRK